MQELGLSRSPSHRISEPPASEPRNPVHRWGLRPACHAPGRAWWWWLGPEGRGLEAPPRSATALRLRSSLLTPVAEPSPSLSSPPQLRRIPARSESRQLARKPPPPWGTAFRGKTSSGSTPTSHTPLGARRSWVRSGPAPRYVRPRPPATGTRPPRAALARPRPVKSRLCRVPPPGPSGLAGKAGGGAGPEREGGRDPRAPPSHRVAPALRLGGAGAPPSAGVRSRPGFAQSRVPATRPPLGRSSRLEILVPPVGTVSSPSPSSSSPLLLLSLSR